MAERFWLHLSILPGHPVGSNVSPQPMPSRRSASVIAPMLAVPGVLPTDDDNWAYETKWDGMRAIAVIDDGQLRLISRNDRDVSVSFPELAPLAAATGARPVGPRRRDSRPRRGWTTQFRPATTTDARQQSRRGG